MRVLLRGAVLFAFMILGARVHAGECSKSVRWANDPPFSMQSADGEIHGIHPDLLREIMKRIPCKLTFVELPWARALAELKSGRLDILPNAAKSESRKEFAYFSRAINSSRNVLFLSEQSDRKYKIGKLADMIGTDFRLGVQIDAIYGHEYESLLANPTFKERLTQIAVLKSGWKMMEAGRLDGQLADELTGLLQIQELGLSQTIKVSKLITSSEPSSLAISKISSNEDFVNRLNLVFGEMLADGSYKKIMELSLPCKVTAKDLGCK